MDIEEIGNLLIDGNNQTGIPLLDTSGHVDPLWLKFAVGTWKNQTEFDVSALGQSLIYLSIIYID